MTLVQNLIQNDWHIRIVEMAGVIVGFWILYRILRRILNRFAGHSGERTESDNRNLTYRKLGISVSRYAIIIAAFVCVLQIAGVNVSSLVAGLGLVSVIVGLALQDWIKDIIRGIDILSDSFFHVGDIVNYKGQEGEVLTLGIKTTRIRLLADDNILSIANRNIEEIQVVSWNYREVIPMPYDLSVYEAEKVVRDIVARIRKNEFVDNCLYVGVTELAPSSINYFLEIRSNPFYRRQVRRDTLRSILLGMEANHVAVPYPQIDIHSIDAAERKAAFDEITGAPAFKDFIKKNRSASSDSIFRKESYQVSYDGSNADEILDSVEHFSWRMGCSRKESLQMRLLTEEMMELVRTITDRSMMTVVYGGRNRDCLVRVELDNAIDQGQKERLLRVSAQENASAGLIDRMRRVAVRLMTNGSGMEGSVWSLKEYIDTVVDQSSNPDSDQAIEELERSIIANIADDVKVSFRGSQVIIEATRSF